MESGGRRPRKTSVLPAIRQHRRDGAGHRVRDGAWPAEARRLALRIRFARKTQRTSAGYRAGRFRTPVGSRRVGQRFSPRRRARDQARRRRRSPSTGSIRGESGTPARTPVRTSARRSSPAAFLAINRAYPRSPAPCTRRRFHSNRVRASAAIRTGSRFSRCVSRGTTCTSNCRPIARWSALPEFPNPAPLPVCERTHPVTPNFGASNR